MEHARRLWYFALPALIGTALTIGTGQAQAQQTTTGVSCSEIAAKHLLVQENMRAGLTLIECGVVQGGGDEDKTGSEVEPPQPPNVQVSNRTCTSSAACTHSESMIMHSTRVGDSTVVVNYNDDTNGNGTNYAGLSYSTDGGSTYTEIIPSPLASGHGSNYGDPLIVYNQRLGTWFAGDLASGCGGFGLGSWKSTDGINWSTAACIHNGSNDDRPSIWVDNNPFSTKYGRMYVSFNNFNVDGGALFVTHSDDGVTWSTPVQLSTTFLRDVQLTGTPPGPPAPNASYTSTVFLAAMDEGGGGLSSRQNIMFRSLDGGSTFTEIMVGSRFPAAGDGTCGYFALMNPIWRHMGWGQPAVGPNGVVHYAYAGKGTLSTGDIFYTRSTDNGSTWSTPIVLNDPETNQYQSHWMPSVNVNYVPAAFTQPQDVTVTWYDRRQSTTACNLVTDPGCNYQRYGIQSTDNGATWGANFAVSTQIIPEPAQDDPFIQSCYAGDYDYSTALNNNAYSTWTDGRVSIGGVNVQNVEGAVIPEP